MFKSTEHGEGHLPPPVHLPAVCTGAIRWIGSHWSPLTTQSLRRMLPKTQCTRMMKIGADCIDEGKGEIRTIRLQVFPLLCSVAGVLLSRRGEECGWWPMLKLPWFAAVPLTNCARFISSGFFPPHFINFFKVSIKSSLVPCYVCYCWAEVIAK